MSEIPGFEPEEVIDGEEIENGHYSDKGSHKERSEFWQAVRRGVPTQIFPDKNMEHVIRRSMNRPTKDGK